MNNFNKKLIGIAAAGMLVSSSAGAVVTFGGNIGGDINGAGLKTELDNITVVRSDNPTGMSSVDVVNGQHQPDEYWEITASTQAAFTIIVEIAGFKDYNKFGIYQMGDELNKVELFDGAASPGLTGKTSLSFYYNGPNNYDVYLNNSSTSVGTFSTDRFGYYLDSSSAPTIDTGTLKGAYGGLFYSDSSLNSDSVDHMAAYQGNDKDYVQLPGVGPAGKKWTQNEYILAWEDLDNNGPKYDNDYTDFMVMVESVVPVPAPATLALLGLGLIGMSYRARRKSA